MTIAKKIQALVSLMIHDQSEDDDTVSNDMMRQAVDELDEAIEAEIQRRVSEPQKKST